MVDEHVQVHKLFTKTVKVARELGLGRRSPSGGGWLFSKMDERAALAEIARRKAEANCLTRAPEYDRRRQRESAARWQEDWRRDALVELKAIELALMDLSRRTHVLAALILADAASPWNKGRRYGTGRKPAVASPASAGSPGHPRRPLRRSTPEGSTAVAEKEGRERPLTERTTPVCA